MKKKDKRLSHFFILFNEFWSISKNGLAMEGHIIWSAKDSKLVLDWMKLFHTVKVTEIESLVWWKLYKVELLLLWNFWLGWKQFGAKYERSGRRLIFGRTPSFRPRPWSIGSLRLWRLVRRTTAESIRLVYLPELTKSDVKVKTFFFCKKVILC